ncbi:hypothetical protein AVEN_105108-1 [Araneus ventricosus]|uniref:Uncharacterized protein n=1 Tax=Araneus ventricosus TaxID=182803 RepID=A0A4Y2WJV5_ARAVE|nr:hypothetical protein AVEN_105108-1 [Araneus ventricosus]
MKFGANGFEVVEFKITQNPKLHPPIPNLGPRCEASGKTIVLLRLGPRCEDSGKTIVLLRLGSRVEARNETRNSPCGERGVWVLVSKQTVEHP